MLSRFFVERPIFANVIAIITIIVGAVALVGLPVEQFPQVTPPTVMVSAFYPGASAKVVADSVAAPIEQQVNGIPGMLYMSSTSSNGGSYGLTITFEGGTDLNQAQILLQNRVDKALPELPEDVKRTGVTVSQQSGSFILFVTLTSSNPEHNDLFLSNYAKLNMKDALSRIPGVGDVSVTGAADYSMRIWLDPEKLKARKLTTQDVIGAIQEQNIQVAAGQIGQPPTPSGQNFQFTVNTAGRLTDISQFQNIIVKTKRDGDLGASVVRVKDVARVELGAQDYSIYFRLNGKPAAGIGISQLPEANALDVAQRVRESMGEMKSHFLPGMEYSVPYDTTKFVHASISEVYKTLMEAGVLVLIVILLFLQDWRAVLVPATTIPVTIIGAFAVMAGVGFSVNFLTLFGLILAIGIVVDDAIVIVENAAHHIEAGGLSPKEATIKAMGEILGPIIGITLVLMAVFLPAAFIGGITGQLNRQFALTIAATALISAVNAVTLKPAQCAVYLRRQPERKNFFFRGFNRVYGWIENIYAKLVGSMVRHWALSVIVFAVAMGFTVWGVLSLPRGFLPTEDQGYALVFIQLPDAASLERTREVTAKVDDVIARTPGVADWVTMGGMGMEGAASNGATAYVTFKDWKERTTPALSQDAILGSLRARFATIEEAVVIAFAPPSISGLGTVGGFQMQVEDRGNLGLNHLQGYVQEMVMAGNSQSGLVGVNSFFRAGIPQLFVDIDKEKVKNLNVPLSSVYQTLQAYLGSQYINDFNKFGRTYQVVAQSGSRFRSRPEDIDRIEIRDNEGAMIPVGTFAEVRKELGPQSITRYNLYPSVAVNGEAAPGSSSGDALDLMEQLARNKLPSSVGYEWTGMAYQEKKSGEKIYLVFGLALLMVYLVLSAQYESWIIPGAVILVTPSALSGAVLALLARGMEVNVYTQIGIVLLIALSAKNAILIVEFARELRARGEEIAGAAVEAARMRFRPILMTSFAFILGVYPLVVAEGASAGSRRALGTTVFGGMIASTFFAVLFSPVFFVLMQRLQEWRRKPEGKETL